MRSAVVICLAILLPPSSKAAPNDSGCGGNGSTTGTFGGNGALLPQPLALAPGY